jgi:hypothetical protein
MTWVRAIIAIGLAGVISACGKPGSISLVHVYVLANRTIRIEDKRYFSILEAKSAIKKIEAERPDARFVLSTTNMSEPQGMDLVRQLSDGDGKIGVVGILTEPKAIKN